MSCNVVVLDIAIRLCLTNENARDADGGFGIKDWEMKLVPIAADVADAARKSRVMMSKIAFIVASSILTPILSSLLHEIMPCHFHETARSTSSACKAHNLNKKVFG